MEEEPDSRNLSGDESVVGNGVFSSPLFIPAKMATPLLRRDLFLHDVVTHQVSSNRNGYLSIFAVKRRAVRSPFSACCAVTVSCVFNVV